MILCHCNTSAIMFFFGKRMHHFLGGYPHFFLSVLFSYIFAENSSLKVVRKIGFLCLHRRITEGGYGQYFWLNKCQMKLDVVHHLIF